MEYKSKMDILKDLYQKSSKHSNYQILPTSLSQVLKQEELKVVSRYEKERLDFILTYLDIKDKKILDIGGNTGYFSIECLDKGCSSVICFEGNSEHAQFVKLSAEILGLTDRISVKNEYYNFNKDIEEKCDITFLLNVLHHVGDDYGDNHISIQKAKDSIKTSINSLLGVTRYLVFQLGYNWKGNRNLGLFEDGTKREMIDYIKDVIDMNWDVIAIGIAEKQKELVKYVPLSNTNIERDDSMGEFLNRPIFILKRKEK